MAIAGFKMKIFDGPVALQAFVKTGDVVTISSIVYDVQSNKYVLFYT